MFKRISLVVALSLGLATSALAAQGSGCLPTIGTVSGLTFAQDVNAAIAALISTNSGASAPATDCTSLSIAGQLWLDTSVTPNALRQYDGSGSWVTIGYVDATNHLFAAPIGGGIATAASASTVDLGALPNAAVTISGTTPITSFGSSAVPGSIHVVTFSGALTLTQNGSSMILPGAANITTQNGDVAIAAYLGSGNWKVISYQPISASPMVGAFALRGNNTGSAANAADILIASLTAKSSLVSGDLFLIADSAASNAFKKTTLANLISSIGLSTPISSANGGTGVTSPTAKSLPVNQGASAQTHISVAQGQCVTADASGNPTPIAGCKVLLNTLNPSNVGSVSDTTSITSAYNDYEIVFESVNALTSGSGCQILLQISGSFQTSGYSTAGSSINAGGTQNGVLPTTFVPCSRIGILGTVLGISGSITISGTPSNTTNNKIVNGFFGYGTTGSFETLQFSSVFTSSNAAVTGFQIQMSAGNLSGTIKVYGRL